MHTIQKVSTGVSEMLFQKIWNYLMLLNINYKFYFWIWSRGRFWFYFCIIIVLKIKSLLYNKWVFNLIDLILMKNLKPEDNYSNSLDRELRAE